MDKLEEQLGALSLATNGLAFGLLTLLQKKKLISNNEIRFIYDFALNGLENDFADAETTRTARQLLEGMQIASLGPPKKP